MTRPTWDTKLRQALIAARNAGPPFDPDAIVREAVRQVQPQIRDKANGVRHEMICLLIELTGILIHKEDPTNKLKKFTDKLNSLLSKPIVIS